MPAGTIDIGPRNVSRGWLYLALISAFLVCIALHWAKPGYIIGQSDINLSDHIWNQYLQCASSWSYTQSYLGQTSWCFSYSPVLLVHAILATVFGDAYGEALSLILPYLIALPGAYLAMRTLGASRLASSAAAFAYVVNPYTQVIVGLNTAVPIFTAAFAWICALMIVAARKPASRFACGVGLAAIFALAVSLFAIMPHLLVDLCVGLALWFVVSAYVAADRTRYMMWCLAMLPLLVAVALWWLIPTVIALASNQNYRPTNASSNAWTFARATLWNSLRLNTVWLWEDLIYFPEAPNYDGNPLVYASGLFLVAGTVGALLRTRGKSLRVVSLLGFFALFLMFLGKGPQAPFGALTTWIMSLPVLFVFQDPAGLTVIATFLLAIAFGFFLHTLDGTRSGIAIAALLFIASIVSTHLFIDGAIFHGNSDVGISMYAKEPAYWIDLERLLDRDPEKGDGVLFLPPDEQYDATYTWDYVGADTIPISLTMRRALVPGPPFGYFVTHDRMSIYDTVEDLLAVGSPLARPVILDLGIRFVVFRHDILKDSPYPNESTIARALHAARKTVLGDLTVWDLGPPRAMITDWAKTSYDTTTLPSGTLMEVLALANAHEPSLRSQLVPPGAARIVLAARATQIRDSGIAVLQGAQQTQRDTLASKAPVRLSVVSTLPQAAPFFTYNSPYVVSPDRLDAAPRAVLGPMLLLDRNRHQPFQMFSPQASSIVDDVHATCHDCYPGERVFLEAADKRYTALARGNPDGTSDLLFRGVSWPPGESTLSFVFDGAGTVRGWDVHFIDNLSYARRAKYLTAFFPLHIALLDKPDLADVQLPLPTEAPPAMVLYVSDGTRTLGCYTPFSGETVYDFFRLGLACLREHSWRTDPLALRNIELTGLGFYENDASTNNLKALNAPGLSVVHWDGAWYEPLPSRLEVRGAADAKVWSFDRRLRAGDLVDAYIPASRSGSIHITEAGGEAVLPLRQISGGVAVGSFLARGETASSIAIFGPRRRVQGATLTVWRRMNRWSMSVDAHTLSVEIGSATVTSIDLPAGVHRLIVRPASSTTVGALFEPNHQHVTEGCDAPAYAVILSCRAANNSAVVLNAAYHPLWVAFERGHLLVHVEVDGWRNGWEISRGGTVFALNLANVIPIALLAFTLLFAFPVTRYLRRIAR